MSATLTEREQAAIQAASCGNCGERTAMLHLVQRIISDRQPEPMRHPVEEEFATVIACLLAGRCDGKEALETLVAMHRRILAAGADR